MIRTTLSLLNHVPRLLGGAVQLAESSARLAVGAARQLLPVSAPSSGRDMPGSAPPRTAQAPERQEPERSQQAAKPLPPVVPAPGGAVEPAQEPSTETPLSDTHVSEEPELVAESADPGAADGAGASLHVSEPWSGYSTQRAADVIDRLGSEEVGALAVVALFEQSNRNRRSVLDAVERQLKLRERSTARAE